MSADQQANTQPEILVGLGANLDHPVFGTPVDTLKAALVEMVQAGIGITAQASWYRSAPVPVSDQPWFINSVAAVEFDGSARELLAILHAIEDKFGRVRQKRWEARLIDLDLLCFGDQVTTNTDQMQGLVLPHPQMINRAFVLRPIAEIVPRWRHPSSLESVENLLSGPGQTQHLEVFAP